MATALPSQPEAGREATDLAECRERLRHGSRTFLAASLLLPREVREPACALYAFCRQADDEVDQQSDGAAAVRQASPRESAEAVARLRERLDHVYAGQPAAHSADRALAHVVRRYRIPQALPAALLDGFEWDAQARQYETLADVQDYAARVAGAVGAMMSLLMGVRSRDGLARACDLGVAMQLSNIARDVGEDARNGRLYLPRAWMREAGIDPDAWIECPVHSPALGGVVQRLLAEADMLYERVDAGLAQLPWNCRPGINAARQLYAAIGHQVARNGLNAVDGRARVAGSRKAWLLLGAVSQWHFRAGSALPPLGATRYLVDAAADPPVPARVTGVEWVLQLFERLEREEQFGRSRA